MTKEKIKRIYLSRLDHLTNRARFIGKPACRRAGFGIEEENNFPNLPIYKFQDHVVGQKSKLRTVTFHLQPVHFVLCAAGFPVSCLQCFSKSITDVHCQVTAFNMVESLEGKRFPVRS